jgi:acetyltransferase-like isoleucine patch superfamily enzyme
MTVSREAGRGQKCTEIADLPDECLRHESLRKIRGLVRYPEDQEEQLPRLKLNMHGSTRAAGVSGVLIDLRSIPKLNVYLSHSDQKIVIGKACSGLWTLRMWGHSSVEIGDGCTSNGTLCWLTPGGRLRIGEDCMFAEAINIHVGDNHAIFDVNTLAPTNYRKTPAITVGDHVWLASAARLLAGAAIGSGSVVATQAVVKGEIPDCSLAAGMPARVVRRGVSWTRSHDASGAAEIVERFSLRKTPASGPG